MSDSIQIAVVDDHKMFLEGVSIVLARMAEHLDIKPYNKPDILLKDIRDGKKYDLIVCDLVMNQMNGLAFVAAARAHDKITPILILSGINADPPIVEMKRLGANGFIHKSAENHELWTAIQALIAGDQCYEGHITDAKDAASDNEFDVPSDDISKSIPILGKRQIEVLHMIADGASNKEISRKLTISENTVKTHLRQIFEEFSVNKRTACVRKAQALGII